jgi:mannosylfructose-6-phosphate phosphatase
MTDPLLIVDLDDALLGDDDALARFRGGLEARPGLALAYGSRRALASVLESIRARRLPHPVAVVGGAGTELVTWPPGRFGGPGRPIAAWVDRLAADFDADVARARLLLEPDLEPRPEAEQGPFKASYVLPAADEARLDALVDALAEAGVYADTLYSSDGDLDFVPAGVNVGAAAAFLADHLGCSPKQVIVATSDAALLHWGFRAIVVGDAPEAVKRAAGGDVYLAERPKADGVTEGLEHWLGGGGG